MALKYDTCPKCGATVVKGAMRCTSCRALLTSPEEQEARIKRYRESQKKPSPLWGILKLLIVLAAMGAAWMLFSEEIMTAVRSILRRG